MGVTHAARAADLAAAELAVRGAIDAVLCADADAAARELEATEARALALRTRLHTYANRRAADWTPPAAKADTIHPGGWIERDPAAHAVPPPIRSTVRIGQALASAPLPHATGPFSSVWASETDAWAKYAAALAADAQAAPDFVS